MNVVLYSTNCPRCSVLKKKLESKGIDFSVCTDVDKMVEMGFMEAPTLVVDGERMDFAKANRWINDYPGKEA